MRSTSSVANFRRPVVAPLLLLVCGLIAKPFLAAGATLRAPSARSSPAAVEDAEEAADDELGSQEQEWQEEGADEVEEESTRLAQSTQQMMQTQASGAAAQHGPQQKHRSPVVVPGPLAQQPARAPRPSLSYRVAKPLQMRQQVSSRQMPRRDVSHVRTKHPRMASRTSLATRSEPEDAEGTEAELGAAAGNHSDIPGLPPGEELASDTCNPPCIEGRGVCNDKICFCKTPFTGVRCETMQAFGPSRVTPGIAGLLVVLGLIGGCCLGFGIIKLFSSAASAATAPKPVSAQKRVKETWRPKGDA